MKFLSLLFVSFLLFGCASDTKFLIERQKVEDTVNRLFIETDNKDWKKVQSLFDDHVNFDMSSLTNNPPSNLSPMEITAMWDKGLSPVAQVHHQSGNFLIELNDNESEVFCYGIATHYKNPALKNEVTYFVGSYNVHLTKVKGQWRIDSLRFNKKYVK